MNIGTVQADNIATRSASPAGARSVNGSAAFRDVLNTGAGLTSGRADLDAIFEDAGRRYNIPPNLLKAVAKVESSFRPNVTSSQGAMGLMQLMPATARYLGVTDPFDPEQNIMGGAKYLREQIDRFDGDISLALAAYNAGWPAVKRHGGIPPFRETQNYVPKVLGYYNGGDITAGLVNFNRLGGLNVNVNVNANGASGGSGSTQSAAFLDAMNQMLFMKIIEMQMNSSGDDKKKVF